jgi:DNA polymerase-3 subunit epsilon
MLAGTEELVAARPTADRGWEVHVVRYGRLAAAGVAARGADPRLMVADLQRSAEAVARPDCAVPVPAAGMPEVAAVLRWLDQPGVRLVVAEPELSLPRSTAAVVARRLAAVRAESARPATAGQDRPQPPPAPAAATASSPAEEVAQNASWGVRRDSAAARQRVSA